MPCGLKISWLPSGNIACTRFRSGISRFRWANSDSMCVNRRLSQFQRLADHCRQRIASQVIAGRPQPASADHDVGTAGSDSKDIDVVLQRVADRAVKRDVTPSSPSRRLSHWAFVSSRAPLVISSPIETTSATRFRT